MGDTNMCTDNPILLKNTKSLPTIICLQKKALKVIPTEYDIIEANKLAFNDDIGTITNRITSMFEIQAGFNKNDKEYKELEYRIMCGQLFQQNAIDRAKGIIAKPMPSYWFTTREIENYGFTQEQIEFDKSIIASHKPYFMTYVYPKLRSENNKYIKNSKSGVVRRFGKYGLRTIEDLYKYDNKSIQMEQYLECYHILSPVGNNPCIVNRIAWIFENEFNSYLSKLSKIEKDSDKQFCNYDILKSNLAYSKSNYDKILQIYKNYSNLIKKYQQRKRIEKIDKFESWLQFQNYITWFQDECYRICQSEEELNNIVIDICYKTESSKQFAWDMCGNVMLKNLLNRNGWQAVYPYCVEQDGEFQYFGKEFVMKKMDIKGEME